MPEFHQRRPQCHLCFYYREVSHGNGECMNRPPHAFTINHGVDDRTGFAQLETFATRPPVRWDDYCAFFSDPRGKVRRGGSGDTSGTQGG